MPPRLVVRDALVATPAALLERATVVVEGGLVAEVAPEGTKVAARPDDWDVAGEGRLLVPGMVDAHTRLAVGALGRLAGLPARSPESEAEYRHRLRARIEDRLDAAAVEALTAAGALAALRAGVTCACDLVRGAAGDEERTLPAAAAGVRRVGLRASLAYGPTDRRGGGSGRAGVAASAAFAALSRGDPLVRGVIGIDGLCELGRSSIEAAGELGGEHGLHACLAEDEEDVAHAFGMSGLHPVALVGSCGGLGPGAVIARDAALTSREVTLLADTGSWLALSPRAALFWGGEFPPLGYIAAAGTPMAFGTDGLFPDVAGEALAAAMCLRMAEHRATASGDVVTKEIWPGGGHVASRLFGVGLGEIAPGAAADLVLLDWRPPAPLPDLLAGDLAMLHAGAPAAWAIVNGEVRLREGHLLGGDEREIAAKAREAAARVLAA
ncbi:amidohydrolase family protein [Anaeromyxobacter paludicola]|uniref:Chlorohydrolase n=1 Tax=Anaeromyxobacter paludicola TaxID=2918171 RepID=A0ABN6NA50_9BACT|nr:amidohydrolase family protein [Anaeromyxobacter paludicola]BDG10104.1 chlorohydrolase [Anaeromyxobacter paludicola]